MRVYRLALIAALILVPMLAAAQVKLESAGPLKDEAASPEIRNALQTEGHRVVLSNGTPLCEIWLVTSLPSPEPRGSETTLSYHLAPGEFVGVISFPHGAKDFRGQVIKAGTYTLRYDLMPDDGNHLGVAPERDFLLLVPLAKDTTIANMTPGALLAASTAASGTSHPAVFFLSGPPKRPLPAAYEDAAGHVRFAGKAGTLDLSLVVKGQAEQ